MDHYYAKLLLFGEYTIIRGSHALAMPLRRYSGHWQFAPDGIPLACNLEEYVQYLKRLQDKGELLTDMDLKRFEREVNRGLYFESDIPVGYGAGSSGALCAAIYSRFAINPFQRGDTPHYVRLKQQLAQLEGYFHGSSSGLDPFICYLNHAVLLYPDGQARQVEVPEPGDSNGVFFLVDTGISRRTGPLVGAFLLKFEDDAFAEAVQRELAPATENAIRYYLEGRRKVMIPEIRRISAFQYANFREMIPASFRGLWEEGLNSGIFQLKLCGAGGGGFLMGYTEDVAAARARINSRRFLVLEKI